MAHQIPIDEAAAAQASQGSAQQAAADLLLKRLAIVNVVLVGVPGQRGWVLIDAGLPGTAAAIRHAAAERFGPGEPPAAIVMTHGHFDHTGVLRALADEWDVPIWAHERELPFLDGTSSYARPDPLAGGGMFSLLSPLFPRGPVGVSARLRPLPADGSVPPMPGWRWIATPGHAPGHTSFWRDADRALIAGDAFITTAQESAYAVTVQAPEIHGPPRYFTPDWIAARRSVHTLAALEPELALTGHGPVMQGAAMRAALHELAERFDEVAVPSHVRQHMRHD